MGKIELLSIVWGCGVLFGICFHYFLKHVMGKTKGTLDDALVPSMMKVVWVCIVIGLGVFTAQNLGLNMNAAYAGLGVVALAASQAFASATKGVMGDIISGVKLAFTRPFEIGEDVTVAGQDGKVLKVTLTETVIELGDDERELSIPNSKVAGSQIERNRRAYGKV